MKRTCQVRGGIPLAECPVGGSAQRAVLLGTPGCLSTTLTQDRDTGGGVGAGGAGIGSWQTVSSGFKRVHAFYSHSFFKEWT